MLMVVALALSGALTLSVLGLYRSCGDIASRSARANRRSLSVRSGGDRRRRCTRRGPTLLIGALALATLVPLLPLLVRAPRIADIGLAMSSWSALRRAAPIGLLALVTVAYYRTGTIALAALADSRATAAFGVAATLAFGLLMIPNAITTALLPRLSADRDSGRLEVTTRRALVWTLAIAVPVSLVAGGDRAKRDPGVLRARLPGCRTAVRADLSRDPDHRGERGARARCPSLWAVSTRSVPQVGWLPRRERRRPSPARSAPRCSRRFCSRRSPARR